MSELMTPIPFRELMTWVTAEYQTEGTVFGVHKPYRAGVKTLPIFGEKIETPFGPAAGPNTQLAQNIIAGYFAGARFFERPASAVPAFWRRTSAITASGPRSFTYSRPSRSM